MRRLSPKTGTQKPQLVIIKERAGRTHVYIGLANGRASTNPKREQKV